MSLESGGILRQTGGDIYGNSADCGGGVYVGPEAAYTQTGGSVGAGGLNTAASAPGVCNEGVFKLEGSRSLENGLWIDSWEAAPQITGPLQPGSVIQLDQSGYLSPGPEGVPIVVAQASEAYPALNQTDVDAIRKPPQGFEHWVIGLSADGAQIVLAPEEYTIHYENLQGAENPNPRSYTYYTPDITLIDPVPQAEGLRFAGWFDALQGGSQVAVIPQGSLGNRTLYARWVEHTLTYHGNDEAGPPAQWIPLPQPVPEGQAILLSEAVTAREGYRFIGWNTQPDGSGTAYQSGDSFGPTFSDADLYAQWIPLPPVSHTLTYCGNDAGGSPACGIPCAQPVPDGQCARVPFCAPYRACYCFTNWNTDPCGRGRTLCPGQAIGPVTENTCLYAQWRRLPPKPCDFCRRG